MNRRGFLTGLTSLLAAPAIVPIASLMPVRGIVMPIWGPARYMMVSGAFVYMIEETLRDNAQEIRASVEKHNALFRRLAQ